MNCNIFGGHRDCFWLWAICCGYLGKGQVSPYIPFKHSSADVLSGWHFVRQAKLPEKNICNEKSFQPFQIRLSPLTIDGVHDHLLWLNWPPSTTLLLTTIDRKCSQCDKSGNDWGAEENVPSRICAHVWFLTVSKFGGKTGGASKEK